MPSFLSSLGSYLPVTKSLKVLAVVGLTALLSGLTGCVSMDEHKRLQTAYSESQAELARAENDINNLRRQITELNSRIAELTRLLDANSGASGALNALQARLADLQKKYDDLLTKVGSTPALPNSINTLLRDLAAQYPDFMEFDENLGVIHMKSDLTFDRGSTEVSAKGKEVLALLSQILNKPEIERNEIEVVGHTDDIPITPGGPLSQRNPDNWTLSTNRAWSVLNILHANGVKNDRGEAGGWGDQRPIAANAPGHAGNVKNRRVDIYIRPTVVPADIVVSTPGTTPTRPPATRPATRPAPPATRPSTRPATGPGGVPIPM